MTEHEERSWSWKEGLARKHIIPLSYSVSLHRSLGFYVEVIIKLKKAQRQKQRLDFILLQWSDDVFLGNERLLGAHSKKTVIHMTKKYVQQSHDICPFLAFLLFPNWNIYTVTGDKATILYLQGQKPHGKAHRKHLVS